MAKRQTRNAPVLATVNDEFNEDLHTFIINMNDMNLSLSIDLDGMTCNAILKDGTNEYRLIGNFEEVQ